MTRTIVLLLIATPAFAQQPVAVTLREQASVSHRFVRLSDVAAVSGGPEALRQKLAEMDIDDLPPDGKTRVCPRTQIGYRLRLAGVPTNLFTLSGAEQVLIVPKRTPLSAARVEEEARQAVYRETGQNLKLAKPIIATLPMVAEDDVVALEARVSGRPSTAGRAQVDVNVRINGAQRFALPVYLEPTSFAVGDGGPLVRYGDTVRVEARAGAVKVEMLGEAMQNGKLGESIRVRNNASQKVLKCRVTAAKTVEVESVTP